MARLSCSHRGAVRFDQTLQSHLRRRAGRLRLFRPLRLERLEDRKLLTACITGEGDTGNSGFIDEIAAVGFAQSGGASPALNSLAEGEAAAFLPANQVVYQSSLSAGGLQRDPGLGITTDSAGNVYSLGIVEGELFLAKYTSGDVPVWTRSLVGWFGTEGGDVAVDASGNVYATGSFTGSVDFNPGSGTSTLTSSNVFSAFVWKLNASGEFVWARRYGGNGFTQGNGIAVDGSGSVYTTGQLQGTADFDPGSTTKSLTSAGADDIYVAKLDSLGNYSWAVSAGSTAEDRGRDLALDPSGNVLVTGSLSGTADFDPGPLTWYVPSLGWEDVFVWKLSASGSLLDVEAFGAEPTENAGGIAVDGAGGIYITGNFYGSVDFDQYDGTCWLASAGAGDAFLVKLDGNLDIVWGERFGGTQDEMGRKLVADALGNVFVAGTFSGTADFDPGAATENLTSAGLTDAFVARFNTANGQYKWAGRLGGTGQEQATAIAAGTQGHVYVIGEFQLTGDFDPGAGVQNLTSAGAEDLFVVHLTYSTNVPSVTINQAVGQSDPTNEDTIDFVVVFSEPVTGFATGDVTLTGGTAPGTLIGTVAPVGVDGTTYSVAVTGMGGSGNVVAAITAGVAIDADGNGNRASTSTDNRVLYDNVGPLAELTDPDGGGVIGFAAVNSRGYIDVTFSDAGGSGLNTSTVTDDGQEFTLSGTGAGDVAFNGRPVLVSGTTYRYSFTGAFVAGSVTASLIAASFYDNAGNPNPAASEGFTLTDVPVLTVSGPTVTEGNTESTPAVFVVRLSYAVPVPVTVQYATANGTAIAGSDYTAVGGTLSFAPNVTQQTVSVPVRGDVLDEEDENFLLTLSNATNAAAVGPGVAWIIDNDAPVRVSVADASITEGNSGTSTMLITVSLSSASGKLVQVRCATADGTAQNGSDYVAGDDVLVFQPGEISKTFPVTIIGDIVDEANETFEVFLSDVSNATILDGSGIGTVNDDDGAPVLTVADISVDESAGEAMFTVSLSAPSGRDVTVMYATANGSAVAPADFAAISGTLVLPAGTTVQTVAVPIVDDSILELTETFKLNLSNANGATVGRSSAIGSILDNEPKPTVSIADRASSEAVAMVFTISLSAPSSLPVTVQYTTVPGTAAAGVDYRAATGTVTISANTLSKTLSLRINNDTKDEFDETFEVVLSNPSGANPGDMTATGTILDDDPLPGFAVTDRSVTEGDAGQVNAVFTVSLAAASGKPTSVQYATVESTATAGGDYVSQSGRLDFAPGEKSKTVTVPVLGDLIDELTETYFVKLSDPVEAVLKDDSGLGTIQDNDPSPKLSINDVTVNEEDGAAVFTVTVTPVSGRVVTVKYAAANNTATAPNDYLATSGTLTFGPGVPTQTISVPIVEDWLVELSETFRVTLSSAVGAGISRSTGTGTILDNEPKPLVSVGDAVAVEGNALIFRVTLSAPSGLPVTVQYATVPVSAISGADFQAAGGTVSFAANTVEKTISVTTVNDQITEADETLEIHLSNPSGADPGNMVGTGTIRDNDAPGIVLNPLNGLVTNENGGTANFTVKLNSKPTANVVIEFKSDDETEGTVPATALTFTPSNWSTTQSVRVTGVNDAVIDGDIPYHIAIKSVASADPNYADPNLVRPVVDVTNRDNDTLGPGTIALGIEGNESGYYYITDNKNPHRIDSRVSKYVGTYTQNDFPILEAFTADGGMAYPEWVCVPDFDSCQYAMNSIVMTGPEYINGLIVTARFNNLLVEAVTFDIPGDTGSSGSLLNDAAVGALLNQAAAAWGASGVPAQQLRALNDVEIRFAELPAAMLGTVQGRVVVLDSNAAGYGWFVDGTPSVGEEFERSSPTSLYAIESGPATGRMDMLTVLTHELGHVLGFGDLNAEADLDQVMAGRLQAGVRRLPWAVAVDAAMGTSSW